MLSHRTDDPRLQLWLTPKAVEFAAADLPPPPPPPPPPPLPPPLPRMAKPLPPPPFDEFTLRDLLKRTGRKLRTSEWFKEWDVDSSGELTQDEFFEAVFSLGIVHVSESDLERTFSYFDPDGSGFIDYKELDRGLLRLPKHRPPPPRPPPPPPKPDAPLKPASPPTPPTPFRRIRSRPLRSCPKKLAAGAETQWFHQLGVPLQHSWLSPPPPPPPLELLDSDLNGFHASGEYLPPHFPVLDGHQWSPAESIWGVHRELFGDRIPETSLPWPHAHRHAHAHPHAYTTPPLVAPMTSRPRHARIESMPTDVTKGSLTFRENVVLPRLRR